MLIDLFASVLVFTTVILLLVAVIQVASAKLVPAGDVQSLINGDPDRSPKGKPGQTLLSALASEKVFIPSACGGGGTCARRRSSGWRPSRACCTPGCSRPALPLGS